MRRTAWITGASGLIGAELGRNGPTNWKIRGLTRAEVDLTDSASVRRLFALERPDLVIHCAAMSKTPTCEANPAEARRNNIEVTRVLANLAADIPLVFFSTDIVFDGQQGQYEETAPVNPLCVYAETKVAAETLVLANPRHTVLRTSLNAGRTQNGTAFNEQWRAAWQRGEATPLFIDELRSPIAASVTARATWELIHAEAPGLYHLSGSERLSRFAIGERLARRHSHLQPRLEQGSIQNFKGLRRSPDTSLKVDKIQRLLSFPLPGFSQWLEANPEAKL